MAKYQGVKEKLHFPIYDSFLVPGNGDRSTFEKSMTDPRMIRFFVDVQNKTKLETNLQASGILPSLNTFEARAMRVAVSHVDTSANPNATDTAILSDLIYNSVTTLLVGEKIMIEMPTFFFPAGAGISSGDEGLANHGEPDPMATFRFAEPVMIEPQQNFRVEISFPQGVPGQNGSFTTFDSQGAESLGSRSSRLATIRGPLRIWVVLDGYLTRDVQ